MKKSPKMVKPIAVFFFIVLCGIAVVHSDPSNTGGIGEWEKLFEI